VEKNQENDKIKELEEELSKKEEMYLRALADFDNYRKRVERDKERMNAERERAILLELLEVVDNFERALSSSSSLEGGDLEGGLQSVYNQLLRILEQHGVIPFGSVGEKFNPEIHEAVLAISTDEYPSGTVIAEMQRGYKIRDEVLRPARVQVAQND
jgi:molecular chaperone GrpE